MKHTAESLKQHFSPLTVMVIGDMRVDMDMRVDFTRISSREQTGIPVGLSSGKANLVWGAGAAANLARNFAKLGVMVYCIGTIGNTGCDPYGKALRLVLQEEANIKDFCLVSVRQTYCYGRYTVGGHLRDRYDVNVDPLTDMDKANLLGNIKLVAETGANLDGVILSDYTEGDERGGVVFPEIVELAKTLGVPTFGSSRDHAKVLDGVDHMVLNEEEWDRQKGSGGQTTVHTCGDAGVTLFHYEHVTQPAKHIPTRPVEGDTNPCGAGDTFLAAYSASVLSGIDYEESCRVGMAAARHTVKQMVGTGYPTVEDIANEYGEIYG